MKPCCIEKLYKILDGYFEVLLKQEVDLVAAAVQIYFWHQQHTSHHTTVLSEAKGFSCLYCFFGVPTPRFLVRTACSLINGLEICFTIM